MPNFKVFQDQAQQMKVQIYGSDLSSAIKSTAGSLDVSATAALPICTTSVLPICTTAITPVSASSALPICTTSDVPITTATALPICTTSVLPICTTAITPVSASSALPICTTSDVPISAATALPICPTVVIPVSVALSTTDVSFTITDIDEGGPGFQRQILGLGQWTYGVVNNSETGNTAAVYLQLSPDANNWINESISPVTLAYNGTAALVSSIFLKYARVYYYAEGGAASAVTLNIFFQGNTVE